MIALFMKWGRKVHRVIKPVADINLKKILSKFLIQEELDSIQFFILRYNVAQCVRLST